eukprot:m.73727 g.73727  ORF g.73727 m.73727 type:complete len:87 (-) comp18830_c0_seq1:598-858(-)
MGELFAVVAGCMVLVFVCAVVGYIYWVLSRPVDFGESKLHENPGSNTKPMKLGGVFGPRIPIVNPTLGDHGVFPEAGAVAPLDGRK